MSEWLPIETAPKNIKVIAGYRNSLGKWRTIMACYYRAGTLEYGEDDIDDEDCAPEGWYEETETYDTIRRCETLTHWQPLPEPHEP